MSTPVLVTGGAGYVGSHACKALAAAGALPVVYDNLSRGHEWAVRWGPLEVGELNDTAALEAVMRKHRVQAVLHFAALAYVGESIQAPGRYFANNVAGSLALLQAMRAASVRRLIFSSTCAIYGVPERMPITEETPTHPVNPYGESKLMVERMLTWYRTCHGLEWIALRYFNAAGADPAGELGEAHDPEPHLIPTVIRAALGQQPICEIYGTDYPTPDGTAVRDFIHVTDLATAHVGALDHLSRGGESRALNLGTGRGHSVRTVIEAVARHAEQPIATVAKPRRLGDPPVLVADATAAQRVLGWIPRHSNLDQIVATAWRWHAARAEQSSQLRAQARTA
ncbi:MAG: UDP-glucose 4-epimerase GalE [Alphaproteobacteria bacterium]|nr:UDP-glucose 4-epimerase GalE [Alphaproteobacteria bacterium]